MRRRIVAGNWKLHGSRDFASSLLGQVAAELPVAGVEVVVLPPLPYLGELARDAQRVLLTGDLNAAVVQVPRLGVFGWYKTYLLLGLPLMDAMEPDEFKAVVAHEFAHLSNQDSRLGSWLYRLRSSWERVMDSLSEQGAPRPLLAFINWFWPRFNASAFVLSRSQEYQADAFAALVTSPQASARGLQRLAVETRRALVGGRG